MHFLIEMLAQALDRIFSGDAELLATTLAHAAARVRLDRARAGRRAAARAAAGGRPLAWAAGGLVVANAGLGLPPVVLGVYLALAAAAGERRSAGWRGRTRWTAVVLAQTLLALPLVVALTAAAVHALPARAARPGARVRGAARTARAAGAARGARRRDRRGDRRARLGGGRGRRGRDRRRQHPRAERTRSPRPCCSTCPPATPRARPPTCIVLVAVVLALGLRADARAATRGGAMSAADRPPHAAAPRRRRAARRRRGRPAGRLRRAATSRGRRSARSRGAASRSTTPPTTRRSPTCGGSWSGARTPSAPGVTFSDDAAGDGGAARDAAPLERAARRLPRDRRRAVRRAARRTARARGASRAAIAVVSYSTPLPQQTAAIVVDPKQAGRLLADDAASWATGRARRPRASCCSCARPPAGGPRPVRAARRARRSAPARRARAARAADRAGRGDRGVRRRRRPRPR